MSSAYSPAWRRWLQRHAPWLFQVCLGGNYHWRWDTDCDCMAGCNGFGRLSLRESVQRRIEGRYWPEEIREVPRG